MQLKSLKRTVCLQNTDNLVAGYEFDLANTMGITQDNTNLRGSQTLLGEFADVVDHLIGGDLQPRRGSSSVRLGRTSNTFARSVHATHVEKMCLNKLPLRWSGCGREGRKRERKKNRASHI